MKRFSKTVRQCLATAMMTSTILDACALPILSAPSPTPSSDQPLSESSEATGSPQSAEPMGEARLETIAPTASPSPPTIEPTTASEDSRIETPGATLPQNSANQNSANQDSADQSSEDSEPIVPTEIPATPIAAPSTAPTAAQIAVVRQALTERLAGIVDRDKPLREAQLRQNLVAAALHYARVGEIDRARQTARHPALPLDVQTETLAQIDTIQSDGVAVAPPAESPASASGSIAATRVPSSLGAIAQSAPQRWLLPASPEALPNAPSYPRFGDRFSVDRCLPRNLPPSLPVVPAKPAVAPVASPQLPFRLGAGVANIAGALTQKAGAVQKDLILSQHLQPKTDTPTAIQFQLDRMVGSTLNPSLQEMGISAPLNLVTSLRTAFSWQDATPMIAADLTGATLPIATLPITMTQPVRHAPLSFLSAGSGTAATVQASQFATVSRMSQPAPIAANLPQPTQLNSINSTVTVVQNPALPPLSATLVTAAQNQDSAGAVDRNCWGYSSENPALSRAAIVRSLHTVGMTFPLPIAAAITSAFGWRIHPITGVRRFHAGVDFGAPLGTPVLAALPGQVVTADYAGGYGLAVVLENDASSQRQLYAHLSAIAVRPGTWVTQGSIIGWVGSTGNSTGPHLHFESQLPTSGGWQAIDPLATVVSTAADR